MKKKDKELRGFAAMDLEVRRSIASMGGTAAHKKGTAHEWTAEEAREAGRKGGMVSRGGRGKETSTPEETSPADATDATRAEV